MAGRRRARRAVVCAVAVVSALVLTACAPETSVPVELPTQVDAALPADTQSLLQAAVERGIAASGASGAVVGVWAPWSGTWLAGLGSVAPEGAPAESDTSFMAGAVTRSMTCDVLYGLVADGVVALDDPVTDHVPGLPHLSQITLGNLCDSTSGLTSYAPVLTPRFMANPTQVWIPRELVAYATLPAGSPAPGSTYLDSDAGYVLLGMALERASGKKASELFAQYVFDPLQMAGSSLPQSAGAQLHGLWSPDAEDGTVACAAPQDVSDLSPTTGFTASGVLTDLADLGRYVQALATGARDFDTAARFENPLPAGAGAPSWFTATGGAYQVGTLIGQFGSIPGYLTAAFADRNTGMTVVIVLNNSRAAAGIVANLAWELAAIASVAPAAQGQTAPEAGLPFTAETNAAQVAAAAICPIP